jgi:hypothetical protein
VGSSCQARTENQFGIDQSRCEECPLLEDEEITAEEMEQLVNMDFAEPAVPVSAGQVSAEG